MVEIGEKVIVPSTVIKDMRSKWSELQEFIKKHHHPNIVVVKRVINLLNDNAVTLQKISVKKYKHL